MKGLAKLTTSAFVGLVTVIFAAINIPGKDFYTDGHYSIDFGGGTTLVLFVVMFLCASAATYIIISALSKDE